MSSSQPNILLITTDQQRADHLGIAGLQGIPTPHLDRLGREGTHFRRAYCSSPLCTPSRVSLLTGTYPSRHGAWSIGVTVAPFPSPTIGELLGQQGYTTALFGKTHFVSRLDEASHMTGMADPPTSYFRQWKGPYVGFIEFQGSNGHTTNCLPDLHYRAFLEDSGVSEETMGQWYPMLTSSHDHEACGSWEIPPELHDTGWIGQLTDDFIQRQADRAQPWFCWASFQDPHEPFRCPEPWFSRVDTTQLRPFPGYQAGEFDDRHPVYNALIEGKFEGFNDQASIPCCFGGRGGWDDRQITALQATLGMIGFIDDQVGRMLRTLENTGQLNNTVIVFTSDHGEMHGHHGFWGKGAPAYEDCQRVPLLVFGPGHVQRKGDSDALVSLVDLPSTFLSLAGGEAPQGMQGQSLMPLLSASTDSIHDAVLVECRPTLRLNQLSCISEKWKLVTYDDGEPPELYNLEEDPQQLRNVWSHSGSALQTQLLKQCLRRQMQNHGTIHPRRGFA